MIMASSNRGLVVWKREGKSFSSPSLLTNNLHPNSVTPVGLIHRRRSIGVAYFVAATHRTDSALVVDRYSRKAPKLIGRYRITLKGVRRSGVQLICPRGENWFATLPWISSPKDCIQLWKSGNGGALPLRMPSVWQVHNSLFSGRNGTELGWVSSGHYVRLIKLHSNLTTTPIVRKIRLIAGPLEMGALSPDGKSLLLLTGISNALTNLGSVSAVMVTGTTSEYLFCYPYPAAVTAPPSFSPNGKLAAFGLFSPYSSTNLARTLIFITSVPGFHILGRISIPGIEPYTLSFSPGGKRLAITASNAIFIFHVPLRLGKAFRPLWREIYRVRRITIPFLPNGNTH